MVDSRYDKHENGMHHARDEYARYYVEKIWASIPEYYRQEDGLMPDPGVLRALVELLGHQAAHLRRSHDRLWDDQFIELCDTWAVPYLADLVGARLVSALDTRRRRVDVAKTIYYRRRKGTARVVEELAWDVTGWESHVVEGFRQLARVRHGLDSPPIQEPTRFSSTPVGGWADLRHLHGSARVGGPFDEYAYTPDVRQHRGRDGRRGIPKLAIHLYRLRAGHLRAITPWQRSESDNATFTIDPSGRDTPLCMPGQRPESWDDWRPAHEWELPAPMPCRLLNDARCRDALIPAAFRVWQTDGPVDSVAEPVRGADLGDWSAHDVDAEVLVDPARGRMKFLTGPPDNGQRVDCHVGFAAEIGAGPYDRSATLHPTSPEHPALTQGQTITPSDYPVDGVLKIGDSSTFESVPSPSEPVQRLTVQAANWQRPYLILNDPWTVQAADQVESEPEAPVELIVDGIWFGARNVLVRTAAPKLPDGPWVSEWRSEAEVVLRGHFSRVTLRHVTLDPGGPAEAVPRVYRPTGRLAPNLDNWRLGRLADGDSRCNHRSGLHVDGRPIAPVPLFIEGHVSELVIQSSITGRVATRNGGAIDKLVIEDSILQSVDDNEPVLRTTSGDVELRRVTLIGNAYVHRLHASEALVASLMNVTDTQNGCFRFGAAAQGSRLPHAYQSHVLSNSRSQFESLRFGHPGYARLRPSAPETIRCGAENGGEIGAFHALLEPIKLKSLKAKVDEYAPFGLIPMYIFET